VAAGVLKVSDLAGPLGDAVRGQVLAGSVVSFIGAFIALRFFMRWISNSTRTLAPFAIYCRAVGLGSFIYLAS
jgi:undecaprenyl-diphosphatase